MPKSVVYEGDKLLGEVEVYPQNQNGVVVGLDKGIRISHFSQSSERCPPLAVLHAITSNGVCFKLESKLQFQDSPLYLLHTSCLRENKTAVLLNGREEIHLVAMHSRRNNGSCPCFWGFKVASGLYDSCLVMLNLRCLGIVFDLDETLLVANTMRSFEDRIEALQRKIISEVDPQRVAGMLDEIKRYQDDKSVLKQYVENDQVVENGKVITSQLEVVPPFSDNHQPIVRPLIRLQEKNIILTRINPLIRDTSILVRLRPAWEDLRSYLTARGRKRFEVYVCTMAERDYAFEMWRLLDPESNLIHSKELLNRIVCVKSGSRKSLLNVFQDGNCHPKMTMVIDDRLKVWDEKDQPRVHVVPAFAPYYAPQAEVNNAIPILCVARNIACNVRGVFFKEFDEGLLQRVSEVAYEDDCKEISSPPDVSNYLNAEDDASAFNGKKDSLYFDGMADIDVERRLKEAISASSTVPMAINNLDPRLVSSLQYGVASSSTPVPLSTFQGPAVPFTTKQLPQVNSVTKPLTKVGHSETILQTSPATEEGEVPESELDPDTRRRLLILQHGQATREQGLSKPQFPMRPLQASAPQVPAHGSWFPAEEEMCSRQLNRAVLPKEFHLNPEPVAVEQYRPHHTPFIHKAENPLPSDRVLIESQRIPKEAFQRDDRSRLNRSLPGNNSFSGGEVFLGRFSSSSRDFDFEPGRVDLFSETPAGALQEIAFKCGTKVEFRPGLVSSAELQFSIEVWFAGEKIGEGIGRTRREAQRLAAEGSLMTLADNYLSYLKPDSSSLHGDGSRFPCASENGIACDMNSFGYQLMSKEESASEPSWVMDPRLEATKKSTGSVYALKELCTIKGLDMTFQTQPRLSVNPAQKIEVYAQVEIDGEILGNGIGLTWDEATTQAAERALVNLNFMLSQFSHNRQSSPRSYLGTPNKRLKPEFSRILQRMAPSARYP